MNKEQYHEWLKTPEWNSIRIAAIQRARYECKDCGMGVADGVILQVHHMTYARVGGKERPSDLEVLCKYCHSIKHPEYWSKSKSPKVDEQGCPKLKRISKKELRRLERLKQREKNKKRKEQWAEQLKENDRKKYLRSVAIDKIIDPEKRPPLI